MTPEQRTALLDMLRLMIDWVDAVSEGPAAEVRAASDRVDVFEALERLERLLRSPRDQHSQAGKSYTKVPRLTARHGRRGSLEALSPGKRLSGVQVPAWPLLTNEGKHMKIFLTLAGLVLTGLFPPIGIPLLVLAFAMDRQDLNDFKGRMAARRQGFDSFDDYQRAWAEANKRSLTQFELAQKNAIHPRGD